MILKSTCMHLFVGLNLFSMHLRADNPNADAEAKYNQYSASNTSSNENNYLIKSDIIKKFYRTWEEGGDYQKLIQFYSPNAIVYNPLHGVMTAPEFIKKNLSEINDMRLWIKDLFILPDNPNILAVHFVRSFPIKEDGMQDDEGVVIFKFAPKSNKIESHQIFYDTVKVREAIKRNQSS